jgi:hypothetical protein
MADVKDLLAQADELPDYEFRAGDVPVLVSSSAGGFQKIPQRMLGRARTEGLAPVSAEATEKELRRRQVAEEQSGILPTLATGLEAGLGAATFGASDWALKKASSALAGISEEEYLRLRQERMEASPIASGIGEAAGIILPAVASLGTYTGVGGAMAAGRAATGLAERAAAKTLGAAALGARSPAARLAAAAAESVLPKAVGGAVEGALWGAGEGVRENILGKSDDLAESLTAHIGTDALLFGALGGGLGLVEAGLPTAVAGAKKAANAAYERLPFFGRRSLVEAAAAAPEKTGIAADTARKLYAEREALVDLDGKLTGALDVLATSTPERIDQVLASVDQLKAVDGTPADPRKVLAAIAAAPAEQAAAVLDALPGIRPLMEASETAIPDLLAAPVDQLAAIVGNADAVTLLERKLPGSFRSFLSAPADQATAALKNADGLLALEDQSKGALGRILAAPADRIAGALEAADGIAQLETIKRGALDAILEAPAERFAAISQHIDGIAELQRHAPGDALRQLLEAEGDNALAVVSNAENVATMERTRPGTMRSLLDTDPARAALIAENGAGLALLEQQSKGAIQRVIKAAPEDAEFFATRAQEIAALEVDAKGAASVLQAATPEQRTWILSRANDLVAMEREMPGSINGFRSLVTGETADWSVKEADSLLNNWRLIMRNPNERERVISRLIEDKAAQYTSGEKLMKELYTAAKADRKEMLRAIGEPGGPPSLQGIQSALGDITAMTRETADKMLGDSLTYSEGIARDVAGLAKRMQEELVGMTPRTATQAGGKAAEILSDPYQAFERISAMRTEVGEVIGGLKKKSDLLLSEKKSLQELQRLYGAMSDTFKDATVWGESAAIRAEIDQLNAEWRDLTGKGSPLRKGFMTERVIGGQKTAVISPPRVNEWVNQIGDARTEAEVFSARSKTQVFHELTTLLDRMVNVGTRAVPSIAKGAVDVGEAEIRSLVHRSVEASADLEKRALYSRIYNQINPVGSSQKAGGTLGFRPGSVNLGGYAHGVPTAGTTGATVAATGGAAEVQALADVEAVASREAQARAVAAEQERMMMRERIAESGRRQAELVARSEQIAAAPLKPMVQAEAEAAEAIPGVTSAVGRAVKGIVESVPVVGKTLTGGIEIARSIPRAQWQVTTRVRGMVAAEKSGQELAAKIESGARKLVVTGKTAGKAMVVASRREERGPTLKARAKARAETVDRMRTVARLHNDFEAFADHMGEQGSVIAGDLPDLAASMSTTTRAALSVLSEALPSMPDTQLDKWEPSAAEIAKFNRWNAAINDPTSLLARAREGTITTDEVRAADRVYPRVMTQLRATVQAQVNEAQVKGATFPRQQVQALETLLGYPLTTESASGAMRRTQQVFSGARRGESEKADSVRPLPGAARVTIGSRMLTPQQAAAER